MLQVPELTLQSGVKAMVMEFVPLQPMEEQHGAEIHLQPMDDPC